MMKVNTDMDPQQIDWSQLLQALPPQAANWFYQPRYIPSYASPPARAHLSADLFVHPTLPRISGGAVIPLDRDTDILARGSFMPSPAPGILSPDWSAILGLTRRF
jgi:hypothetical protein